MSTLLPAECNGLLDAPYPLFEAIALALRFLKFEELPEEDSPPKRIWLDGDAMTAHWNAVRARMKQKYGGGSEPSGPMETNDAAKDLIL